MAEDINNYIFDFKQECKALLASIAPKKDIAFVEINIDRRRKDPATILQTIGETKIKRQIHSDIKRRFRKSPHQSSLHSWIIRNYIYSDFVALRKDESLTGLFGEKNKKLMRLFTLYHETGHALFPGGPKIDKDHPYREGVADAYAALRLLQRFGQEAVPLLSMISWIRASDVIFYGDTAHFSSTILDRIISDSATRDFSALPPDEITKLAKTYAQQGTPSPVMLQNARRLFTKHRQNAKSPETAHLVLETALRSKSPFAFYIGAKYFDPFMHPEGIYLNGKRSQYTPQQQERYRARIDRRAGTLRMPRIARHLENEPALSVKFNKSAKKPLAEFLHVVIPAKQKRFAFMDY